MQAVNTRTKRVLGALRGIVTRRVSAVAASRAQSPNPSELSTQRTWTQDLLLGGRKVVETRIPVEAFPIAGVSFGDRQKLIRHLEPDQIVYLEREPWNQYDLLAVRVLDLSGRVLGYIPRRDGQNARFKYEGSFGLIASTGPAKDTSVYGARLYARPELGSLLLDPIVLPSSKPGQVADLQSVFGERWAALRATTLAAANYRCEVTGVKQEQLPLELTAQWCYNVHERAAQLTRLVALSAPLADIKVRLGHAIAELAANDAADAAALLHKLQDTPDGQLFTEINGIGKEDAVQYFEFVWRRAQVMRAEQWRVEVLL